MSATDDNLSRAKAWVEDTQSVWLAQVEKAKDSLPEGGECGILAGLTTEEIASRAELQMSLYTSEKYLVQSPWVMPYMQWALDPEYRWDYVERVEYDVISLILGSIGAKLVSFTKGFAPGYDALVDTDEGLAKIEIKMTEQHEVYIEGGRYDMTASGLSATDADVYLIITRNQVPNTDDAPRYTGKVRMVFVNELADEYARLAAHSETLILPNRHGPGSRGVHIDIWQEKVKHVWLGDIKSKVDQFTKTMYNTSAFSAQPYDKNEARAQFNQGMRKLQKLAERNKEPE